MHTTKRVFARAAVILALSLFALSTMTGTSSAHAQLEASDPPSGALMKTAPTRVTLTFGERVEVATNAIEVFDDHLQRVDTAKVARVPGDTNQIRVGLRANLRDGTYVVSWRVSSSDTHPVAGSLEFSVGAPSQVTGRIPGAGRRNEGAAVLLGLMRGVGYAGLVLAPGVLLVSALLWPAGLCSRRTRRMLYVGSVLLAASILGSLLLEGVWASGQPLSAMWSAPDTLDSHSRRFDFLYALRFYLLVVFVALMFATIAFERMVVTRAAELRRPGPARKRTTGRGRHQRLQRAALRSAIVASSAALFSTWTLAGHAATGMQTRAAIISDLLHVSAMAVWLGGLAVLTVSLRAADRSADLTAVLPRFSRLAFSCVVVLVGTGGFQSWREVGSLAAVEHTRYGHLLLIKVAAALVVIGLGNLARRWVQLYLRQKLPADAGPGPAVAPLTSALPVGKLQRGLVAELTIAVTVLATTAALVVLVPGRQAYVKPFERDLASPGLELGMRIDAPRVGDTVLHLTTRSGAGTPIATTNIRGSVSRSDDDSGPLPIRLINAAPAARLGTQDIGLTFPKKGRWLIQLTVQTSPFDATAFSVTVSVS